MSARACFALTAVALLGCARERRQGTAPKPSTQAALFFTADLSGYLAPCGCSENMRGGIARTAHVIEQARRSGLPTVYLDAGNALFAPGALPAEAVPQQERKARALAEALRRMGVQARAAHGTDLARGPAFLASLGLPDLKEDSARTVPLGGHTVGVLSVATLTKLPELSRQARAAGAEFVVALAHHPLEPLQAAAEGSGADLLVVGHARDAWAGEESRLMRSHPPVVRVQSKGRSLLRVDLAFAGPRAAPFSLRPGAADRERSLAALDERIELLRKQVNAPSLREELKRARQEKLTELVARRDAQASAPLPSAPGENTFTVRFVPLEATVPSLPAVKEVVAAYDAEVGQLNLEWAKAHGQECPAPAPGQAAFVGNEPCRICHRRAFAVWEASKHARAYATLEHEGKQFHLDCVKCHVTGADQPGGVCRIDRVEGRQHVGCEGCHGPGSLHLRKPNAASIQRGNAATHCVRCHDPENSPHFEFPAYLAQILGPGHGAETPTATDR